MNDEKKFLNDIDHLLKCIQNTEKTYNEGLEDGRNEVWELAKKLVLLDSSIGWEIFGTCRVLEVLENFTPQEALAKLEAYEKEQAEIKVGDVVEHTDNSKAVVLSIDGKVLRVLTDLHNAENWHINNVIKTGKHIDIQSVLEQINGGKDYDK